MLIISDTNILSSLAAGDALPLLFRLFPNQVIYIPPVVYQELLAGLARRNYLTKVLEAIKQNQLQVLVLSTAEQTLAQGLPARLNQGECEAIALTQSRRANLLSNDKRAVRYCQMQKLNVVDLADLLRLFWIERIVAYEEVEQLVTRIERVENLILSETDRVKIFAPRPRQGRRR